MHKYLKILIYLDDVYSMAANFNSGSLNHLLEMSKEDKSLILNENVLEQARESLTRYNHCLHSNQGDPDYVFHLRVARLFCLFWMQIYFNRWDLYTDVERLVLNPCQMREFESSGIANAYKKAVNNYQQFLSKKAPDAVCVCVDGLD